MLSVHLTPDEHAALKREASAAGRSCNAIAHDALVGAGLLGGEAADDCESLGLRSDGVPAVWALLGAARQLAAWLDAGLVDPVSLEEAKKQAWWPEVSMLLGFLDRQQPDTPARARRSRSGSFRDLIVDDEAS